MESCVKYVMTSERSEEKISYGLRPVSQQLLLFTHPSPLSHPNTLSISQNSWSSRSPSSTRLFPFGPINYFFLDAFPTPGIRPTSKTLHVLDLFSNSCYVGMRFVAESQYWMRNRSIIVWKCTWHPRSEWGLSYWQLCLKCLFSPKFLKLPPLRLRRISALRVGTQSNYKDPAAK